MPELVMTAFALNRLKTLGLEPFDNVGTVRGMYLYTPQRGVVKLHQPSVNPSAARNCKGGWLGNVT